jgi:phosphopantetheinyl transferase (holo-ACP synthase)
VLRLRGGGGGGFAGGGAPPNPPPTRKALGKTLAWQSVEVRSAESEKPELRVSGHEELRFHVSLSHTDDLALAMVVAEG